MLDKTIPYKNILMRWTYSGKQAAVAYLEQAKKRLPAGWSLSPYQPGDALNWVRIQKEAGEFASESEAEVFDYFQQRYGAYPAELSRRSLFVRTASGEAVGSCLVWKEETDGTASLHWLAVSERAQGQGAGTALIAAALARYLDFGETTVWLHTQPWSYQAIRLYLRAGFVFVLDETQRFGTYENETREGLAVLNQRNLLS